MNLSNLKPPRGSRRNNRRAGRGESSGLGKTAGRGHKGQKSRSGKKISADFEGGQMTLVRRVPKFGFHNPFRKETCIVNLRDLERFEPGTTVDLIALKSKGMISPAYHGRVKILAKGELKKSLTVKASAFSKAAVAAIQKLGGTAEVVA